MFLQIIWNELLPYLQFDEMLNVVICQWERFNGKVLSIKGEQVRAGRICGEPADGNVINRLPVAVVDFKGRPRFRHTGGKA